MFELPHAKRVRRADLDRSRSSSADTPDTTEDSATATADLLARLNNTSQFTFEAAPPAAPAPIPANEEEDDDTFAFNLFSNPSKSTTTTTTHPQRVNRIRLDSPSDSKTPGLRASRPESFYRASPSSTLRAQLGSTALDGASVLRAAHHATPGLRQPWRVTHIPANGVGTLSARGLQIALSSTLRKQLFAHPTSQPTTARRKGRPGKKARLKRRVLARAEAKARGAREAAEADQRDKAERVAAKKRAVNRKKQHRKREKRREAGGAGNGEEEGDGGGESG